MKSIQAVLGITQSGVSQHLMTFRAHRLVSDCRQVFYRLRQPELERLYVRVTALADRTKTVDDAQLTAIIRDELAVPVAVSAGARLGDATCH